MTDQELFDRVAAHLLAQGRKSLRGEAAWFGGCAYRGSYGAKCAIGCVIPDDEYRSTLEGTSVTAVAGEVPALDGLDLSLLRALQRCHDTYSVAEWPHVLAQLAAGYGLTMPPVLQAAVAAGDPK